MKDGARVAVVAVLGAGCCLALPLLLALAASVALYVVGGLLVAAAALVSALLVIARVRSRHAAARERPRPTRARVPASPRRST